MDRARVTTRGALLCAAAALVPVMLAACGSSQAPGTGAAPGTSPAASSASPSPSPSASATQAALCQDIAAVTGLEIMRSHILRVPQLQIAFPGQVTVATPAQARAVARALCALPLFPRGVIHCPAQLAGTTYLLRFTADGRPLPVVTVEATGCEAVTGVGPSRWASTSPGFWRVLATAANLSPPGRTPFSGESHAGPACPPSSPSRPDQINGCPALAQPSGVAVP